MAQKTATTPGFVIYYEDAQLLEELEDADLGQIMHAVMHYARTGEMPELQGYPKIIFGMLAKKIDLNAEKYEKKRAAAQSRWGSDAEGIQTDAQGDAQGMQTDAQDMHTDAEHMHIDAQGMRTDAQGMHIDAIETEAETVTVEETEAGCYSSPQQDRNNNGKEHITARAAHEDVDNLAKGAAQKLQNAGCADPFAADSLASLMRQYDPHQVCRAVDYAIKTKTSRILDVSRILRTWKRKDDASDAFSPELYVQQG